MKKLIEVDVCECKGNFSECDTCNNDELCTWIKEQEEFDLAEHDKHIRAEVIEEFNKKIDYLKNCYVDACNMCTRMECDVCAISNFVDDLEQLKEQK